MHATSKNNLYQSFITWKTYLCHNIETFIYAHDEKTNDIKTQKKYLGGNPLGEEPKNTPKINKRKGQQVKTRWQISKGH
jgi:hypothetical protein